jgi:hypothetical protein
MMAIQQDYRSSADYRFVWAYRQINDLQAMSAREQINPDIAITALPFHPGPRMLHSYIAGWLHQDVGG